MVVLVLHVVIIAMFVHVWRSCTHVDFLRGVMLKLILMHVFVLIIVIVIVVLAIMMQVLVLIIVMLIVMYLIFDNLVIVWVDNRIEGTREERLLAKSLIFQLDGTAQSAKDGYAYDNPLHRGKIALYKDI